METGGAGLPADVTDETLLLQDDFGESASKDIFNARQSLKKFMTLELITKHCASQLFNSYLSWSNRFQIRIKPCPTNNHITQVLPVEAE